MNTINTNEIKFPTNGNCKKVRDITNNISYGSVTEAAKKNGVSLPVMSVAIRKGYLCKGSHFMFEEDLHKNTDVLCAENAKANARAVKAEARVTKMEAEMAEFHQWKVEQEAKRKAEEKARREEEARLAKIRKEEEKRKAKIAKLEAEIERRSKRTDNLYDKWQKENELLIQAERELEDLLDMEVK